MKFVKLHLKKVLWGILIIYVLLWSYWYLAIQYGEHRQNRIERTFNVCWQSNSSDENKADCSKLFDRFTVKTFFIFKPVLIDK